MPKYFKTLILIVFVAIPVYSFAKNENSSQGQGKSQGQGQDSSDTGVAHQNQIQTQNEGEDQQLQVSTQQESSGEDAKGKTLKINEKASEVSKYVQELLNMPERNGGIGEQVREVARAQNQSQEKVMEKVQKMERKGKLLKFIFGPQSEALAALKEEMKQNEERTQTLKELKLQLWNSVDQDTVQSLIDAILVQDVALVQKIMDEESAFSLFGALKALFS
ncbi:hypothetical protein ACFL15_01835 [Patescibacteria group bacterium]